MEHLTPKNSIPNSLQVQLADLNFLSQIERNMKPCCNDRVLVDSESWSGALYRFFKGETRITAITKVEQIVNNAIEAIENKKFQEHLSLTINALYKASNGLLNLTHTYQDDPNMKARINVQIENINIQLERYKHLIKGYSPVDSNFTKTLATNDSVEVVGINTNKSTIDLMDSNSIEFDKKKMKRPLKKTE
jgi:hypothetical protein